MKKKFVPLFLLTISLVVTGCNPFQDIINSPIVDTYDHAYDNLAISTLQSQYMTKTYTDYAKYNYYANAYCPSTGHPKLLIVPVWFTDSGDYIINKDNVRNDIQKAYLGTTLETGWESVTTYYQKDSFGKVTIEGTVLPWFECGKASTYYYVDAQTTKTTSLVNSAYNYAKEYIGTNLTEYDTDQDGFLDGIMLIYGAPDEVALNRSAESEINAPNLWAYAYWTGKSKNVTVPPAKAFFWASYDFMYSYGTKAISRAGSNYGSGDTTYCYIDAHTYIHEMGHVFGLDDYYDYSSYRKSPALGFSMQDENIGAHDPFSRLALGWAKAYIPTETSKFKLKTIENSGEVILLRNNNSTSAFNEYILIEFYSPERLNKYDVEHPYGGYQKGPEEYGLRVWHVDARLASFHGWSVTVTDDPSKGGVIVATNNSTYEAGTKNRAIDYAGSYDYNELQVIRRNYQLSDENGNEIPDYFLRTDSLLNSDLFREDDYFTTHKYRRQFVNRDKMNNNSKLGWSFYVDDINLLTKEATITCIKN